MTTWFITGTSTGFGRIMAETLIARGDRVAATARDLRSIEGLAAWKAVLDVRDLTAVRSVVDRAFAELGRIDVIVSNAGYGLMGAAEEATDQQMLDVITTNLLGSMQVVRAALPHLRAQGGGHIIQLSTVGGQAAFPGGSMYHAGKWGIEGFMDAVAQEVASFGIGVTIVEPGGARTDFRHRSAVLAAGNSAYDATPIANVRRIMTDRTQQAIGDPVKMVDKMIACVGTKQRRLVLGSDAYKAMHAQLTARLAEVEAQRESAGETDY
ncbi:MAG: SDR family oxidoreductase [Kofleriaceae bacterium]